MVVHKKKKKCMFMPNCAELPTILRARLRLCGTEDRYVL